MATDTVSLGQVDQAPMLNAYLRHAEAALNRLVSWFGNGQAAPLTVTQLAAMDPQRDETAGALAIRYQSDQQQAEQYRADLNGFDVSIADIAAQSAQVTDAARAEVAGLVTAIGGILATVPQPKPTVLDQLNAMARIEQAVEHAEQSVIKAHQAQDQLSVQAREVTGTGGQTGSSASGSPGGGYMPNLSGLTNASGTQSGSDRPSRKPSATQPVSTRDRPAGQAASPQAIYNRLRTEYRLTHEQAAGILGNISQESGFDTGAIGDHGSAFGLCQWRLGRRAGLEQFAAARGKSVTDWEVQVDYMMAELGSDQSDAWSHLRSAKTPRNAAEVFDQYFERSDGKARFKRVHDAETFAKTLTAVSV
ncbi:phage tail tip lysozyme [Nocardia tengchongensis]|uniref:phage tail tip lysozyme n=1 Tax=Nocardia tengchongensis TaxID=2055889 RepID=UPI0036842E31